MQSTKTKVVKFLRSFPNYKTFLNVLIKKEMDKIYKEIEKDNKEEMIEKAKELFEYDTASFKKSVFHGFKYKLEILDTDDSDYKVLKSSVTPNYKLVHRFMNVTRLDENYKTKGLKIFRVLPTDKTLTESKTSNLSKFLLLHGTKAPNVEGILKTGYKPSQSGYYGPGVYLTDSFKYAHVYAKCFAQEQGMVKKFSYFFVNQINQTDVRGRTDKFRPTISYKKYLDNKPIVKVFSEYKKSFTFGELPQIDGRNGNILQGTFQLGKLEKEKIILAHHDLIVPSYLIEIEEETSVEEILEEALQYYIDEKDLNKVQEITFEMITKELEKEIIACQQEKLDHLKSECDSYINSVIEQLSFKFSSIFENSSNKDRKYKTKLLQKENDEYNFILRSITDINAEINPKILHIFKIKPVEKHEVTTFKDNLLFLNGIKSNNVNEILNFGYPKKQSNSRKTGKEEVPGWYLETFRPTLKIEIDKGISYCEVGDVVKKLSFVFVAKCSEESYRKKFFRVGREDCSGSCVAVSFHLNAYKTILTSLHLIPAYLIIFELE